MRTFFSIVGDGAAILVKGMGNLLGFYEEEEDTMYKKSTMGTSFNNGIANTSIKVSQEILDDF